jgi:SAM-dependent methyltransferase
MTAGEQEYAFGNALEIQRRRHQALEETFDPGTIRRLVSCGVRAGWRCLEVGAGGGSIARWLCDRVAPGGDVLATDLDTTVLRELTRDNLEVRVHDVLADELPACAFDLVHARLLLAWLPEPERAIERLVAALKPGGVLVCEELDFVTAVADPHVAPPDAEAFERVVRAHNAVLAAGHGFDVSFGRRLPGDLADAGLAGVACEGTSTLWRGGAWGGTLWQLTFVQLRERMAESGEADAGDVDRVIAMCADPAFASLSPLMMAAWGRRPDQRPD